MTVQCIPDGIKDHICAFYSKRTYTLKEIAHVFNTSQRTVNRILIERGLATPVARIKGDAYAVMAFLRTKDITTVDALKKVFTPRPTNPDDVQDYLNTCSADELTSIYYRAVHAHTMRSLTHATSIHVPRAKTGDLFAPA